MMVKKSSKKPTAAELEILSVLWQRGSATVRDVHETLACRKPIGYTTTLKLMQNMHEKGLVVRDESQRSHVYRVGAVAGGRPTDHAADDPRSRHLAGRPPRWSCRPSAREKSALRNWPKSAVCSTAWKESRNEHTGKPVRQRPDPASGVDAAALRLGGSGRGVALAAVLAALRRQSARVRYLVACGALALAAAAPAITFRLVEMPAPMAPALSPADGRIGFQPVAIKAETPQVAPSVAPTAEIAAESGDGRFLATDRARRESAPAPGLDWRQRVAEGVQPLLPWCVAAWLGGVLMLSLWHISGWLALYRCRAAAAVMADEWTAAARRLSARLGLRRGVQLLSSAAVRVPCVLGWLKPAILMPLSVLGSLSPDEIEAILAHELAHVRRWDYLVNLLQTALETLLFYHPAVWWISARIRAERENCCDDLAVAVCGNRRVYAGALASLAQLQVPAISGPGGLRLEAAAADSPRSWARARTMPRGRSSWLPPVLALVLVLAVLSLTGLVLLHGRQSAGDPTASRGRPARGQHSRESGPGGSDCRNRETGWQGCLR